MSDRARSLKRTACLKKCRRFYQWLLSSSEVTLAHAPTLFLYPDHHAIGPSRDGRYGFGAFLPSRNEIHVALRVALESSNDVEASLRLCFATIAHEFRHWLQRRRKKAMRGLLAETDARMYGASKAESYLRGNVPGPVADADADSHSRARRIQRRHGLECSR